MSPNKLEVGVAEVDYNAVVIFNGKIWSKIRLENFTLCPKMVSKSPKPKKDQILERVILCENFVAKVKMMLFHSVTWISSLRNTYTTQDGEEDSIHIFSS